MLKNWNFHDPDINSTKQQINRQKSAFNLQTIEIDKINKKGIFYDKKREIKTNIEKCECRDFNFVGSSPRKKFAPCMHIYRLAIELGLMEVKHIDRKTKAAMFGPEELEKTKEDRLKLLEKDTSKWGNWHELIHQAQTQKNRQYRAYEIINEYDHKIQGDSAVIGDYNVTLNSCDCPDFEKRALPCKHIYCLALLKKIDLYLMPEQYQQEKKDFEENFDPIVSIGVSKFSKFDILISTLLEHIGLRKIGAKYLTKRLKITTSLFK